MFNPIMASILRSPLHGMLSGNTVLINVTGRKSGKVYTVPVNYARDGGVLLVTSTRDRSWWKNLRGGAPITVTLKRKTLRGMAQVIEDDEAVAENLAVYLRGIPQAAKYFKVTLGADGQPAPDDVAQAARERVIVRIALA